MILRHYFLFLLSLAVINFYKIEICKSVHNLNDLCKYDSAVIT